MPMALAKVFTEHSARAALVSMGMQMGMHTQTLTFLGRWLPADLVEDYTRDSRTATLKVVKELTSAARNGWRPDESTGPPAGRNTTWTS